MPLYLAIKSGQDTTTTELQLLGCGIDDDLAAEIADMLKSNTTLTALYLGDNQIGAAGTGQLAEALKSNTTLTTLRLGIKNDQIENEIEQALARNKAAASN